MAKENENELNLENIETPESILDENGQDTFDWKADSLNLHGRFNRAISDLKKYKIAEAKVAEEAKKKTEEPKPQDKKDFDYAEKSYLLSNGIKKEEIPLFWEESQKTGKDIDFLLEAKYFQNELKEKREFAASQEALPSGTKRSGGMTRDVDYWVKKGEMPSDTPENQKLRREIVNAQIKAEQAKTQFTGNPIV